MNEKDVKEKIKKEDVVYKNEETEPMMVREAWTAYNMERIYTYEYYLNWPEDERVELIDGKIYNMSAPTEKHQRLLGDLYLRFGNYLHGKSCEVYISPFDVRIDLGLGKDSVVQPDLVVICDLEHLDEKGLNGPPTLIIEVLSPSNPNHDRVLKYNKYLSVGVKEYWIVDPRKEAIMVNLLKSGYYETTTYQKGDLIKVSVLENLTINVTDLFEGYKGKEIIEVEMAREEERDIANKLLEAERKSAEVEKIEMIKKLINLNIPIEQIAIVTNNDKDAIANFAKEISQKR